MLLVQRGIDPPQTDLKSLTFEFTYLSPLLKIGLVNLLKKITLQHPY